MEAAAIFAVGIVAVMETAADVMSGRAALGFLAGYALILTLLAVLT
jgi:hypothetical protein